ncbi:hypothetical protein [Aliarcobacter butzleri]|uniref:hypothetical protein n=1 Tax=Aliarcobacter butzleri TaxID=28197 RepID=UPI003AF4234E
MEKEDKFVQEGEIQNYIRIGKTKIKEIIKSGFFVSPIYIDGFAYPLYSVKEIQQWIEEQKQRRNTKK